MIKRWLKNTALALFTLSLSIAPAAAQQTVHQSGSVTPGHVPVWVTTGVIADSGSAAAPSLINWLTSIGVTASGSGICQYSDHTTAAAYQRICLGVTTAGGGQISV